MHGQPFVTGFCVVAEGGLRKEVVEVSGGLGSQGSQSGFFLHILFHLTFSACSLFIFFCMTVMELQVR